MVMCTWYLANKCYYTIIVYFMNLRLQRVNWARPYELRNTKTKFMSEITPKTIWKRHNHTDKNLDFEISEATACFGVKFRVLRKGERRSNSRHTFEISLFPTVNSCAALNCNVEKKEIAA